MGPVRCLKVRAPIITVDKGEQDEVEYANKVGELSRRTWALRQCEVR